MRKSIARMLVVVSVLTGLLMATPMPSASAHHVGGHHCKWRPHIHPKKLHKHPHHLHQCKLRKVYPPR